MREPISVSTRGRREFRLLLVQRRLTHYRVPFFEALRKALARSDVELVLVVGNPTAQERTKNDEGHLDWAQHAPCRYYLDGRLCRQDFSRWLSDADAVVLTQENKLLDNLPLLLGRSGKRVGLWGHGTNLQATGHWRSRLAQTAKASLSRRADWWFAYTDLSARLVRDLGFPADRITSLNNAVDTGRLKSELDAARAIDPTALRRQLGIRAGPLGVFLGSLYDDKRLDLLLAGALEIRKQLPSFQVVVLGAGPLLESFRDQCKQRPWIRVLGAVHGEHKARWLACANVLLNPGLVGLGVLDSFVAELPMVTTDCGLHSPEIAYLETGVNGLMTAANAEAFAAGVISVVNDSAMSSLLRLGCAESARKYSLEAMVQRFCDGVQRWRQAPAWR